MGGAKNAMMEQQDQGWAYTDSWVCVGCVDDDALEAVIREEEDADFDCDFCGAAPSAPVDVLMGAFVDGIRREYDNALNCLYIEDGEFQGASTMDTYDLVHSFEDVLLGEGLVETVIASMDDVTWVERDFAWRPRDVVLTEAWDLFCQTVKFGVRYMIWLQPEEESEPEWTGEVAIAKVLHEVGNLVERLDLVRVLEKGALWWRAQKHDEDVLEHTAARLGTSPPDLAKQPNRMNPAGIPMFYGARDSDTAIREVAFESKERNVTIGRFVTSVDANIIDFTKLPSVPSIFDPKIGNLRRELQFLNRFVTLLTSRVRPEWEAVDYVPTQVLTEYFLRVHRSSLGPVVGLVYASGITGESAIVLDVPNVRCVDVAPDWEAEPHLVLGLEAATVECRALTPKDRRP